MQQIIGINLTREELVSMMAEAVHTALSADTPGQVKKRLLTQKDVAAEFGIKERMLEKWRSLGGGPGYTIIGKRAYYERDVLEAWIVAGRVKTSEFNV